MKNISVIWLLALILGLSACQTTQRTIDKSKNTPIKRIVILGSSTAAGVGPKNPNNTWVNRLRREIQLQGLPVAVLNLAVGGYSTFQLMPDDFQQAERPKVDKAHNISQALRLNPSAIVLNLPSNDTTSGYPITEQKSNFIRIVETAHRLRIPIWITTTQPRNVNDAKRAELIQMRDWLKAQFGNRVIDFWSEIAEEDGKINAQYNSGDGIHLNDEAHALLFERVKTSGLLEAFKRAQ